MQRPPSGFGDAVVLGVAVIVGLLPCAFDPALLLETNKRGIECALIQSERIVRHLLEPRGDVVGMHRTHALERAQYDEVECALKQLDSFLFFTGHSSRLRANRLPRAEKGWQLLY